VQLSNHDQIGESAYRMSRERNSRGWAWLDYLYPFILIAPLLLDLCGARPFDSMRLLRGIALIAVLVVAFYLSIFLLFRFVAFSSKLDERDRRRSIQSKATDNGISSADADR
jgi:hypothetical protein